MTTKDPILKPRIEAGTAPDEKLDELIDAFRKLAEMAGADPDEAMAFTIVRRDAVRNQPRRRWWQRLVWWRK